MPARLLREGILDSDAVNSLSPHAELFYRRLMSVVDDHGRFDGRIPIIRGRLYALQLDRIREADITRWIAECVKASLVRLYSVNSKPYIMMHKLNGNAKPRNPESKYPPPPNSDDNGLRQKATDNNGEQRITTDNNGEQKPPYSDSGSDTDSVDSPEPSETASEPIPATVMTFPVVGSDPPTWDLRQNDIDQWQQLYPTTDVLAECRKALAWTQANPAKKKTPGGMKKFIVNWLNKAVNSGSSRREPGGLFDAIQPQSPTPKPTNVDHLV